MGTPFIQPPFDYPFVPGGRPSREIYRETEAEQDIQLTIVLHHSRKKDVQSGAEKVPDLLHPGTCLTISAH
jgi:hypothetical protein